MFIFAQAAVRLRPSRGAAAWDVAPGCLTDRRQGLVIKGKLCRSFQKLQTDTWSPEPSRRSCIHGSALLSLRTQRVELLATEGLGSAGTSIKSSGQPQAHRSSTSDPRLGPGAEHICRLLLLACLARKLRRSCPRCTKLSRHSAGVRLARSSLVVIACLVYLS